jgi:pimeloyl-ACP methyl ester carboxylesterase
LADIRPRQIKTLSLIAPAGLGPEIDGAALYGIARASSADSLAPWLKRLTARPEGISHDFAKAAILSRIDPALRAAQLDLAEVLFPDGVQAFDLTAALSRVTAPTMMLWGRDDHILPWKQALAAPGEVALHLMRGVGHVPHMEDPEAVAALIGRQVKA